jgi:septum formation protein
MLQSTRTLIYHSVKTTWFYRSIDERSLVYFADNPKHIVRAYTDSGEGIDRAGGFAIQVDDTCPHPVQYPLSKFFTQGLGGMLIRKIDGDYNNVVGFPASSFFKLLDILVEEDPDFLEV